MNERVNIILGPPGTGKTTTLLNIVDEAIESGTPPERIAYLAFTRKAAYEAQERAMARFGIDESRLPFFRTLHSLAFRQLGIQRDEVMTESHYRKLGRTLGVEFRGIYDDAVHVPIGDGLGDKCARIETLSRMRMCDIETQFRISNERDLTLHACQQYANVVQRYKNENGLLDFTDMLQKYNAELDVDICIFDEAQDLSTLQYKMAINLSKAASKIYIAGDDDQAIFGWAGADIRKFLSLKGARTILPQSYRTPYSIHKFSKAICSRIKNRYEKEWNPREDKGNVEWVSHEEEIDLSGAESWMLLSRSKFFLTRFKRICHQQGYAYKMFGASSTDTSETRAIISWEGLRKGKKLTVSEAKNLIQFIPAKINLPELQSYGLKDFGLMESANQHDWMTMLRSIAPDEREYLRACLHNGEKFGEEPRIIISTIHQVKGGEADNVVLVTDMGGLSWKASTTDEEIRVWYVAATRARKNLFLVRARTLKFFDM
jgi:superfamily I DNA/RNA helicase|tara:strand:+ start:12375 stop:13838 length:1464 start_codon:yes stop_codon:yes gene_type:complete